MSRCRNFPLNGRADTLGRVGYRVRHLRHSRPLRNDRWIWVACGVFALIAVLSARDYPSLPLGGSTSPPPAPYHRGDEIHGTRGPEVLRGTPTDDLIFGYGGVDTIYGGAGDDLIDPGSGKDVVDAGPGNDWIRAFDGHRDVIDCGSGHDTAFVDPIDTVINCEEIFERPDYSLPATPSPP